MPLELFEVLDLRTGPDTTLDCLDRPTRGIGLRRLEKQPMHWLEYARDLEKLCHFLFLLLHRVVDIVRRFLTNQHSPLPKSAAHAQVPPTNPAGNLVPERVDGKCHAHSGSRASPLRVPPPWVYY